MSTTRTSDAGPASARPSSWRWWLQDREGRLVLAQPPNAALLVWLTTVVVGWTGVLDDGRDRILIRAGQGALLAWALDELARGATPARRVLGAGVAARVLFRLLG